MGLIPGSGRSPGGGHGHPLQYSCLENPMDKGAWRATVHRVAKSLTWLKRLSTCTDCLCRWRIPGSQNRDTLTSPSHGELEEIQRGTRVLFWVLESTSLGKGCLLFVSFYKPLRDTHLLPNIPKILGYREVYPDDIQGELQMRAEGTWWEMLSEHKSFKLPWSWGASGARDTQETIKGRGRAWPISSASIRDGQDLKQKMTSASHFRKIEGPLQSACCFPHSDHWGLGWIWRMSRLREMRAYWRGSGSWWWCGQQFG